MIMISNHETDTHTNSDLVMAIPINPELIMVSSLDTDSTGNPNLSM